MGFGGAGGMFAGGPFGGQFPGAAVGQFGGQFPGAAGGQFGAAAAAGGRFGGLGAAAGTNALGLGNGLNVGAMQSTGLLSGLEGSTLIDPVTGLLKRLQIILLKKQF
jgi:hypothetical protein